MNSDSRKKTFIKLKVLSNNNVEVYLSALLIVLYLSRTAFPIIKYPFIALFIGMILHVLIKYRTILGTSLLIFIKKFYVPLILFILLNISFLATYKLYLTIFKDIVNGLILFIIFFILIIVLKREEYLKSFIRYFFKLMIFFSILFSIYGIIIFFNTKTTSEVYENNLIFGFLINMSENLDTNFALLPGLFSVIAILFGVIPIKRGNITILNLILIVITISILISASRRGLSALVFILIYSSIKALINIKKKNISQIRPFRIYIVTIIALISISIILITYPSNTFRNKLLTYSIFHNSSVFKHKVASLVHSYYNLISPSFKYMSTYNKIWEVDFDPFNPDTWPLTPIHKTIYPLKGTNNEILPEAAKGYFLNKESFSGTWNNNAYSFTEIGNDTINANELFNASVYCFVSEDFNGDWVRISSEGSIKGISSSYYDLSRKNTWQKLSFTSRGKNDIVKTYLFICMYDQDNFSKLSGHVIFAVPEFTKPSYDPREPSTWGTRRSKIIDTIPTSSLGIPEEVKGYLMDSTCNADSWNNNAYSYTLLKDINTSKGDRIKASVYCYVSKKFNGDWVRLVSEGSTLGDKSSSYNLNDKGTWQNLSFYTDCMDGIAKVYLYFSKFRVADFSSLDGFVIYVYPQIEIIYKDKTTEGIVSKNTEASKYLSNSVFYSSFGNIFSDRKQVIGLYIGQDPIRNITSKLVSEDTTYQGYSHIVKLDTLFGGFAAERLLRWEFALKVFNSEYSFINKVFGGGFSHLNWYGEYFYKNRYKSDWPHNPILSILLYSGIFGLIIYCIYIFNVLKLYIRHYTQYNIMPICFLLTSFFAFFSGGSPFDPPIMGFFLLFPSLIDYCNSIKD